MVNAAHWVHLAFIAVTVFSAWAVAMQLVSLLLQTTTPVPPRNGTPGISVLKPLAGTDEGLEDNLRTVLDQHYPDYEVLFGVRDPLDPAYPVASALAASSNGRARVVAQQGSPGLNPKVNQLITLAAAARNDIIVINDSNIRVPRDYLSDIAALLSQPGTGIATHLVAGVGEETFGSILDNFHLTSHIAPNICGARFYGSKELVIGKSMAMRRSDLAKVGGFESMKDILAEDWMLGAKFQHAGFRVALSPKPVYNVSQRSTFGKFFERYSRWALIQRSGAGLAYVAQIPLFPVAVATITLLAFPRVSSLELWIAVAGARCVCDQLAAKRLRPPGFKALHVLLAPVRELAIFGTFLAGFFRSTVEWRGNRLRVGKGTVLIPTATQREATDSEARPGPVQSN